MEASRVIGKNLSLRQVAVGGSLLGLLNRAILPGMTEDQRERMVHLGRAYARYEYPIGVALHIVRLSGLCVPIEGVLRRMEEKAAVFGMALGSSVGMLTRLVIRIVWHI